MKRSLLRRRGRRSQKRKALSQVMRSQPQRMMRGKRQKRRKGRLQKQVCCAVL